MKSQYVIVKWNWTHVAFPANGPAELAAALTAISGAVVVEGKGYGENERFIPDKNAASSFEMRIVPADRMVLEDEVAALRIELAEVRSTNSTLATAISKLRQERAQQEQRDAVLHAE